MTIRETPRPSCRAIEKPPFAFFAGGVIAVAAGVVGAAGAAVIGVGAGVAGSDSIASASRAVARGEALGYAFTHSLVDFLDGSGAGSFGAAFASAVSFGACPFTQSMTRRYGAYSGYTL